MLTLIILFGTILSTIWGYLMLTEVVALKDQVAATVVAATRARAALTTLSAKVAELAVKLGAALANAVTDEDKTVLVQASGDLKLATEELAAATPE